MTKESYDELLAKVNSKYKEPKLGLFWCNISKEWDFKLSFDNVLRLWDELGFDWDAHDEDIDENGRSNRRLNFFDADGKVVGNILTISGQGWRWEWPQLVIDIRNYEKSLTSKEEVCNG
jgi:hypothetical protein